VWYKNTERTKSVLLPEESSVASGSVGCCGITTATPPENPISGCYSHRGDRSRLRDDRENRDFRLLRPAIRSLARQIAVTSVEIPLANDVFNQVG
jgi:hypothetical protein